jgi:hypothetical protein
MRSSPNAAFASRRADSNARLQLVRLVDDAHALAAAAGRGLEHDRVADLLGRVLGPRPASRSRSTPGHHGTPAAVIALRAPLLSPITSIARGPGPMNTMPAFSHARTKWGRSLRNP